MTTALATRQNDELTALGQVANHYAAQAAFTDYRSRKARNTITRQDDDLGLFEKYLSSAGVPVTGLSTDPQAWQGVTWGLVTGFVKWQVQQGFAIGSINVRLSTIKTYARLAAQAGTIAPQECNMIRSVQGYRFSEGAHVDQDRDVTRVGTKKSDPVKLTTDQARLLKKQPNTPQGRRDAVLTCLMLDLGLRVGEVASLKTENVNFDDNTITFYREKVSKQQTHRMTNGLLTAMRAYIQNDATEGALIRSSLKSGTLTKSGMNRVNIAQRIARLGQVIGVDGLSPHDLRHYWATRLANNNVSLDKLMSAGGWSSPAMPMRYIVNSQVANEGCDLGD